MEERNHEQGDDNGLWEAILSGEHRDVGKGSRRGYIFEDIPQLKANHSVSSTLLEELLAQLRLEYCTDEERRAAEFIIEIWTIEGIWIVPIMKSENIWM